MLDNFFLFLVYNVQEIETKVQKSFFYFIYDFRVKKSNPPKEQF